MIIKQRLERLANETNLPCVTISMNTYRTHPENLQDKVLLKNLLKEAEERVIAEFGKRPATTLLDHIRNVPNDIDIKDNLDSLHIFISNDTLEFVRSKWPVAKNAVHISDTFSVRPLIKDYNRSEEYLILLLSQGGVQLYEALDDDVISEINNGDFPFQETRYYITHGDKASDPKQVDNMVREFFNQVDKAVGKVYGETELKIVVICTEDNFSRFMQVADMPGIYLGYVPVDYNRTDPHDIAKQSWELIKTIQQQRRTDAIAEMNEAVSQEKVITDLQEIFQASLDGRGDLLIVQETFAQPVLMTSERTFKLVEEVTTPNVTDDITDKIAWSVISKKGRVVYIGQENKNGHGPIMLKTRY